MPDMLKSQDMERLCQRKCMKVLSVFMLVLVVQYVFGFGTLAYVTMNMLLDIMNAVFSAHLVLLPALVNSPIVSFFVNAFLMLCSYAFLMELNIGRPASAKSEPSPSTWDLIRYLSGYPVVSVESEAPSETAAAFHPRNETEQTARSQSPFNNKEGAHQPSRMKSPSESFISVISVA